MRDAFGTVLVVVVVLSAIGAVWAALGAGQALRQIGRGGLSLEDPAPRTTTSAAAASAEHDAEIRQFLEARNARRVARGQEPVDVEAELARLTAPAAGAGGDEIEAEVRQLVEARNARRARAGKPPLDVETEVARRLRELT